MKPTCPVLYSFNDAHYSLHRANNAFAVDYHTPGNAPTLPDTWPGEITGGGAILWQPRNHRAALIRTPKELVADDWRDSLKSAFGTESINLRFLIFDVRGGNAPRPGEFAVIVGHSVSEQKLMEEMQGQWGLSAPLLLPAYAPILNALGQSAHRKEKRPTLLFDVTAENTLLLLVRDGAIQELQVLPLGIDIIGESIREVLNLRFAGSALRLLFNGTYDFTSVTDAIAEKVCAKILPVLQDAVPSLPKENLDLAFLGLPDGSEWLVERIADSIGATPLHKATDLPFLKALATEIGPDFSKVPLPLGTVPAVTSGSTPWLGWSLSSASPLDRAGQHALDAVRLSEEEIKSFSHEAGPAKETVSAVPPSNQTGPKESETVPAAKPAAAIVEPIKTPRELRREALRSQPAAAPAAVAPAKAAAPAKTKVKEPVPVAAVSKPIAQPTPTGEKKKSPMPLVAMAAAAVVVIGGAALFFMGGNGDDASATAPTSSNTSSASVLNPTTPTAPKVPAPTPAVITVVPEPEISIEIEPESVETATAPAAIEPEDPSSDMAITPTTGANGNALGEITSLENGTAAIPLPTPPPPPPTGSLHIVSEPVDAEVWINGAFSGFTPLLVPNLDFGTYEIELRKDHYIVATSRFDLATKGQQEVPAFTLVRETGTIVVETTPKGVPVKIIPTSPEAHTRYEGVTPVELSLVETGEYRVEMVRPNWAVETSSLIVEPNGRAQFSHVYPEGSMTITSSPSGAQIFDQNHTVIGKTPYSLDGVREGSYSYSVGLSGYESKDVRLSVISQKQASAHVELIDLNGIMDNSLVDSLPVMIDDGKHERDLLHRSADEGAFILMFSVVVDKSGNVETIDVLGDHSNSLRKAALRWAEGLSFRPALRKGSPVRTRIRVPIVVHTMTNKNVGDQLIANWDAVLPQN